MFETGYVNSGKLVNRKFREFFLPTVLSTIAGQLGVIIDSIIVGNFIDARAMASVGGLYAAESACCGNNDAYFRRFRGGGLPLLLPEHDSTTRQTAFSPLLWFCPSE